MPLVGRARRFLLEPLFFTGNRFRGEQKLRTPRQVWGPSVAPLQHTLTDDILSDLQAAIGAERWHLWFDHSAQIHVAPDEVKVGVANLFISDYLKSHFADQLADAVRSRLGRDLPITFRVQPDLFQKRRAQNLEDEADAADQLAPAGLAQAQAHKHSADRNAAAQPSTSDMTANVQTV